MDKKLKQLKETWKRLDEFMRVHDYDHEHEFGGYKFNINGYEYFMVADESAWKQIPVLDVAFGLIDKDETGHNYIDYETTLNDVDATDVITTVLDMTFRKAESSMPSKWILAFNPTKDDGNSWQEGGDTKRANLYKRVVERMGKKYGWKLTDVVRMDLHNLGFVMNEHPIDLEEGKIRDWFSKQKEGIKEALWKTYQELLETKEAGYILRKLVTNQPTSEAELKFLKSQALDVLRGLGLGAIAGAIPGGMGIVFLLKKIGDKVGFEVLPSSFKQEPE